MEEFDVLQDIASRTGGDIYIGVVGPVRTGKSTFVKRFLELLVLPRIEDEFERQRTWDELPQSGAGRTVMTSEPKFIPAEGVEISLNGGLRCRVRLVDSVGYPVEGALGYTEGDFPRLVLTPWFDHPIPFQEAAEVGTRKVIADHSTIGVVVTADGSFGEIPRERFVEPERRVIGELKELGKPFLVPGLMTLTSVT
jgi:stage IV sporulation protein A